jgi:hypothetical protein
MAMAGIPADGIVTAALLHARLPALDDSPLAKQVAIFGNISISFLG